jgi:hypothetical protein
MIDEDPHPRRPMIPLLAKFFRMVHAMIGISAPPPGQNECSFVLLWLGLIAFFLVFCGGLFYLMVNVF